MANKIYINRETTLAWRDSGGDEAITLASLGAGSGRNGALHDFAASPKASRFHLKFFCQFNVAPTVGGTVSIYIREAGVAASASKPTNDDGTGDVALSNTDKLRNLKLVAILVVDESSTAAVMSVEAMFESAARHFGPVVLNDGDQILHATAANNGVDITPIPDEIQ